MPIVRRVNKDFFKSWNADMAYVLGFFAADGSLVETKRNTFFLAFSSADRESILAIKKALKAEHKVSVKKSSTGSVFRLQIGSKEMFDDVTCLGFHPNKSSRMVLPHIPRGYVRDFIRGYFDGDGNIWIGNINKSRKKPTRVAQVAFTSGSSAFLEALLTLLRSQGIQGGSIYHSKVKHFTRISLSTLDALKLYEIMYNVPCKLFLKRKKLIFERFISMRS